MYDFGHTMTVKLPKSKHMISTNGFDVTRLRKSTLIGRNYIQELKYKYMPLSR